MARCYHEGEKLKIVFRVSACAAVLPVRNIEKCENLENKKCLPPFFSPPRRDGEED